MSKFREAASPHSVSCKLSWSSFLAADLQCNKISLKPWMQQGELALPIPVYWDLIEDCKLSLFSVFQSLFWVNSNFWAHSEYFEFCTYIKHILLEQCNILFLCISYLFLSSSKSVLEINSHVLSLLCVSWVWYRYTYGQSMNVQEPGRVLCVMKTQGKIKRTLPKVIILMTLTEIQT